MVGERQTVGQYLESWLQAARTSVRTTTWTRYEQYVRLHVSPTLGEVALAKLSAQQVQALYAAKLAEGLSQRPVQRHMQAMDQALGAARRLEMRTLTPQQARTLLSAAGGDRFEALYALELSTGMREGELLALQWGALDLDAGTVQVRVTVKRTREGFTVSEVKTARGRRKLRLTPTAVEALRRHRARQLEERLALGPAWKDHDLVFPNGIGRPMEHTNLLRRHFWPLRRTAGLPRIRFHDLRHTAATRLLLEGINPKVVSEMLGHASVAITLDLYSHVLPDMQRDAAAALERVLAGPREPVELEEPGGPTGVKTGVKRRGQASHAD